MLKTILDGTEIEHYQDELKKQLTTPIKKEILAIGQSRTVYWNDILKFWSCPKFLSYTDINAYKNIFGITLLSKPKPNPITIQINIPKSGLDRRHQGALAKDNDGNVYLIHRGKLGNHRKSVINEQYFDDFCASMKDGPKMSRIFIIGRLYSDSFIDDLAKFIYAINDFKQSTPY